MFSRVIFCPSCASEQFSGKLTAWAPSTMMHWRNCSILPSFIEKLMRMETELDFPSLWLSCLCGTVGIKWAKENVYSHFYEENVGIVGRNFFFLKQVLAMSQSSQKSIRPSPLQIGWSRKSRVYEFLSRLYLLHGISPWSWRYMFILSQKMSTWIMPWSWLEVSEHDLGSE